MQEDIVAGPLICFEVGVCNTNGGHAYRRESDKSSFPALIEQSRSDDLPTRCCEEAIFRVFHVKHFFADLGFSARKLTAF